MTDKELLELAAKAAGVDFIGLDTFRDSFAAFDAKLDINYDWNPLEDDGDALRLAMKLGLDIEFRRLSVNVWCTSIGDWLVENLGVDGDLEKKTRRVIVRAAAEIGKAMP